MTRESGYYKQERRGQPRQRSAYPDKPPRRMNTGAAPSDKPPYAGRGTKRRVEHPGETPPRRRKSRRRRGSYLLLYIFLAFVALGVLTVLSYTVFFRIDTFQIRGETRYSREEILKASGIRQGDNLLRISKDEAGGSITAALPYVERVNIKRVFPSTLRLEITEAVPSYVIVTEDTEYLTSGKFRILEKGGSFDEALLRIRGIAHQPADPGKTFRFSSETQESRLRELLSECEAQSMDKLSKIDMTDISSIRMLYDRRIIVILGTTGELQRKISAANRIITGEIGQNVTGTLDLSRVSATGMTAPFREHPLSDLMD